MTIRKHFYWLISGCLLINGLFSTQYTATAQSVVDIVFPNRAIIDTILVVQRSITIEDRMQTDTLVPVSRKPDVFRITGVKTPERASLRIGGTDISVFLVPGFPLILTELTGTDGRSGWQQGGPASSVIQVFDSILSVRWQPFVAEFRNGGERGSGVSRWKLLDDALGLNKGITQTAVRDYFNYQLMRLAIDSAASLLDLNDQYTVCQRWLPGIINTKLKNDIVGKYRKRLNTLIATQSGTPAPHFSLPDSSGRLHHLADFRGKLVYLDLWASWCLPCRLESPVIQRLVTKYKNNPVIVFVGIAVSDKTVDWKKALRQDRPGWLQLLDKNTVVANAYAVTSVPRYVLIDRQGKIIA
ncbi:MAG: TlpA family protein disulfide reductase, partial [Sphingobacteriales bacterium]